MIAELATIPMEDTGIPLLKGVIPIIILLAAQITLSLLSLKNQRFRKLICGAPTILIKNGKIMFKSFTVTGCFSARGITLNSPLVSKMANSTSVRFG